MKNRFVLVAMAVMGLLFGGAVPALAGAAGGSTVACATYGPSVDHPASPDAAGWNYPLVYPCDTLAQAFWGKYAQPWPGPVYEHPYADWSTGQWYNVYERLATYFGLTQGFPDGTFRPYASVTRAQFAKMLDTGMGYPDASIGETSVFGDVYANSWYAPFVADLVYQQVIVPSDYPGKIFSPDQPITRAEMAAWVGRALQQAGPPVTLAGITPLYLDPTSWDASSTGLGECVSTMTCTDFSRADAQMQHVSLPTVINKDVSFPDLPSSTPDYADIQLAAEYGLVQGYPDGTFHPENTATRAQAAAMLVRLLNELTTANPPSANQLMAVGNNLTDAMDLKVCKLVPDGSNWNQETAAFDEAGVANYATSLVELSTAWGDFFNQLQEIENSSTGWGDGCLDNKDVVANPVFLGARVAEIESVTNVPQYGRIINDSSLYVNEGGNWLVAGGGSLMGYNHVAYPWFTAGQKTPAL